MEGINGIPAPQNGSEIRNFIRIRQKFIPSGEKFIQIGLKFILNDEKFIPIILKFYPVRSSI